jgi:hypothetical protein
MAQMFKHRKKRSTGIMYELLVRQLGHGMVENDKDQYNKALMISRKYFAEGTVLAQEKELFDVILSTRGLTENAARRVLLEVRDVSRKIDTKKLEIKKSNLIKEINHSFGNDFYDQRIPDYRLLATIQMFLEADRGQQRLTESVQRIHLEEALVRHMTTRESAKTTLEGKGEVDMLVMNMVAKRFNERYSASLLPRQKKLLERYIRATVTGDQKPLVEMINEQSKTISEKINEASSMKEVITDPVMLKKLAEAKERWQTISRPGRSIDELVEEVMLFQKLVEEIESNG